MDLVSRALVSPLTRGLFNFTHSGLEKLPKDENFIFAMNHQSVLEVLLMPAITMRSRQRKLSIMVDKAGYDNFFVGGWLRLLDSIRVDRSPEGDKSEPIEEALDRLRKGNDVLIFPEGDVFGGDIGQIQKAKTGAIRLALLSKKKIVPVGIEGSYKAWKFPIAVSLHAGLGAGIEKARYRPKFPKIPALSFAFNFFEGERKRLVKIRFGRPIDLRKIQVDLERRRENTRRILRKLTDDMMLEVARLSRQKYALKA